MVLPNPPFLVKDVGRRQKDDRNGEETTMNADAHVQTFSYHWISILFPY